MILKYDFENNFNFSYVLGVNLCQFEFVCKIHYNFELRRCKIEYKIKRKQTWKMYYLTSKQ